MVATEVLDSTLSSLSFDTAKNGADAYYWHIPGTTWGVKFFCSRVARDINYDRQQEGIDLGVAPLLGDKVECKIGDYEMFGYVTEHVDTFTHLMKQHFGLPDTYKECKSKKQKQLFCDVINGVVDAPEHLEALEAQLLDKISGFSKCVSERLLYDFHEGNWGVNKDGIPVMIDFSRQDYQCYD